MNNITNHLLSDYHVSLTGAGIKDTVVSAQKVTEALRPLLQEIVQGGVSAESIMAFKLLKQLDDRLGMGPDGVEIYDCDTCLQKQACSNKDRERCIQKVALDIARSHDEA